MAEAFGAAVSVLTLSEQTIKTISKLRALREFIKTLPRELEDLIDESEIVQAVLISLKSEAAKMPYPPSAERRLYAFQTSLESVILEISKQKDTVAGQRFGALKLILKKDVLRTYRQNLEYMKSTLSLLQQTYHSVTLYEIAVKLNKEEVVSKQGKAITISEKPQHEPQRKCYQEARKTERARHHNKREFRIRTPLILIDKLWTISTKHAFSTWGLNIKVNNVIPDDSPVMEYCDRGEITEIQRLFSAGLASPFDCDPDGWSLLHVAALNHNLDLCRFLLQAGADPGHRDNVGTTCIRHIDVEFTWQPESKKALLLDLYKLFIADAEEEFFCLNNWRQPNDLFGIGFNGPAEALRLIQSHHFERYSELPLELRWERAMTVNPWVGDSRPLAIRTALGGGDSIDPSAFRMETDHGATLLHRIAQGIASAHAVKRVNDMAEWRLLLAEAISASANLSQIRRRFETAMSPLQRFLQVFVAIIYRKRWYKPLDDILWIWLSELKRAGVDLEAYGANQQALFKLGHVSLYLPVLPGLRPCLWMNDDMLHARVLGLEYGPEPEDWHIFITNPVDEYVGEFWESVQRSLEVMPGTWVD